MLKIILIRPAKTDFDLQQRIQGTLDMPLCQEGNEQVQQLRGELADRDIRTVYASPCQAARDTAEPIAQSVGAKFKPIDKLKNVDHGLWQGKLRNEVKEKQPKVFRQWTEQPQNICPPEGESFTEASRRMQEAMTKILKKNSEGAVAVVAAEPMASLIASYLRGTELCAELKNQASCGSWEVIDIQPKSLAYAG